MNAVLSRTGYGALVRDSRMAAATSRIANACRALPRAVQAVAFASDQVKRVSVSSGARPPGRTPRRTSRTGIWAREAMVVREVPSPFSRQFCERPITSARASALASSTG